jgi:hypothetical protein
VSVLHPAGIPGGGFRPLSQLAPDALRAGVLQRQISGREPTPRGATHQGAEGHAPEPDTAGISRPAEIPADLAGLAALEGHFHEVVLRPDGRAGGGADEGEGQSKEGEAHGRVVFKMGCLLGDGTAAGVASVGCVAQLCSSFIHMQAGARIRSSLLRLTA